MNTQETESTPQEGIWQTKFGEEYTKRNDFDNKKLNELYLSDIGISRTQMNEKFIGSFNREIKILEVGCNLGMQLVNLQEIGFKNLYGIELQSYAVEDAKRRTTGINIIQGTAYDIPFKDNFFDLVFTNRVLIHINPVMIGKAMEEIVRCSSEWIYGSEYFSEELTEIKGYHGETSIAWKRDFAKLYEELFPELKPVREEKYKYTFNDDVDSTFLFRK